MVTARAATYLPGMRDGERARARGVLPLQHIKRLIEDGKVCAESLDEVQVQPASLDLRLGEVAYQLRASFLPGRKTKVLEAAAGLQMQKLDLTTPQILQKGSVYIVPALESLDLPPGIMAKANPKSTTGRLDVFARLITDEADQFDAVRRGYTGPLFIEIAPKTFNIQVRRGTKLNQLRFLTGRPSQSDASRKAARAGEVLVYGAGGEPLRATVQRGLWLTVELTPQFGEVVGWRAHANTPVIDFDQVDFYDPHDFWEPIRANQEGSLILNPGDFYILGSKERVRVPPSFAAEMVPYDPGMGEFRVHYAGFFDPGFGYGGGEVQGTRAILEVRSHDVAYVLRDGQNIARLLYEVLIEPPARLYGSDTTSSYQHQHLGLGKQFRTAQEGIS